MNAGIAGLMLAVVLGKRLGFMKDPNIRPHNLPFVMLGAGLLWFGWFGFNAGSELAADATAGLAWTNTLLATSAALLGWLLVERLRDGHATSLGAASGAVAGLVAVTPACGFVDPVGAILIGTVAGAVCALAVGLKFKIGLDDSLDVVAVHFVGGLWGTLSLGFFALPSAKTEGGLFYGGGLAQFWPQLLTALIVTAWSAVMTTLIGFAIHKTIGMRVSEADELSGIDVTEHAETAYELLMVGGSFHPGDPHAGAGRRGRGQPEPASRSAEGVDMKLVTAIVRPERVDAVSAALEGPGVNGLTVSQASGYGRQRGMPRCTGVPNTTPTSSPKRGWRCWSTRSARRRRGGHRGGARTGSFGDGKIWTIESRRRPRPDGGAGRLRHRVTWVNN